MDKEALKKAILDHMPKKKTKDTTIRIKHPKPRIKKRFSADKWSHGIFERGLIAQKYNNTLCSRIYAGHTTGRLPENCMAIIRD